MAYENEKKMLSNEWEEKIHSFYTPMDFQTPFGEMHLELLEIENLLEEAGMSGLNYRDMENEILACKDLLVKMNAYIPSVLPELQMCLDKPLYKHFDKGATEALSRIHMEDYTTENILGIKTHTQMQSGYGAGNFQHLEKVKNKLSIEDFLGLTMHKSSGNIIDVPNDFKVFTDLFKADYEIAKENFNQYGKDITLEEYLKQLQTMGEYQHTMDQPVKQFVSDLLDVTIIKPFIEACTGKEFITGEDLSDFDRNMKGISAVIGIVTLGQSGFWRMPLKKGLEFLGKSVMLDMLSTGVSYGTSELCKKLNLPEPITLLLSGMTGISVSIVGGNYLFPAFDKKITSFRDLMPTKEIERYDDYWNGTADHILKTDIEVFRQNILHKKILKTTGGTINAKVITVAIDTNTGKVYYGISGQNGNPTRIPPHPKMKEMLERFETMTNYPLDNCGEYNAVNNALYDNVSMSTLRIYSVYTKTGNYKSPCINCENLYGNDVYFVE